MRDVGRLMVVVGGILVLFGLLITFQDRLPLRIGRLPGDFSRLQRFSAGILAQATENKRADFKFSL